MKNKFQKIITTAIVVLISILAIFTVVNAGTITPPGGTPAASFYTLSEIYEFIVNNTVATAGGHSFAFSSSLSGTGKTLTEIYSALTNLVSADKVKLNTTYLNVAGTLVPSGGDATAANVLSGKTFFGDSQSNWTLQTGAMANNGSFSLTCGVSGQSVTAGYYSGGTLAGDADLVTGNIKSGVNIFGVVGDSNVVNTSSGDAVNSDILSGKKAWVDGVEITGNVSAGSNVSGADGLKTFSIPNGIYSSNTCTANDADLTVGNIKKDTVIFGVTGTLAPDGTAAATDCLSTKTFYSGNSWTQKTGSIANCSSEGSNACYAASGYWTATSGANVSGTDGSITFNIPNGYYSSKTCTAVDGDLTVGNIKKDVNILGVTGTANVVTGTGTGSVATASQILLNYYAWGATGAVIQGSALSYGLPKTGQTTSIVTNDDGTYQKGKPSSGTHYQDNGDGTITDNATGLMWVKDPSLCGGSSYPNTWASALNTPAPMDCDTGAPITACEALTYATYSDWRAPNIKELQSIVNYGRENPAIGESTLESPWAHTQSDVYCSSTNGASYNGFYWQINFTDGSVFNYGEHGTGYVRCVRL
jgi:hypothetical protein